MPEDTTAFVCSVFDAGNVFIARSPSRCHCMGMFLHDVSNRNGNVIYTTSNSVSPGIDGGVLAAHLRATESAVGSVAAPHLRLEMQRTVEVLVRASTCLGNVTKAKNLLLAHARFMFLRRSRGHSLSGAREYVATGVEKRRYWLASHSHGGEACRLLCLCVGFVYRRYAMVDVRTSIRASVSSQQDICRPPPKCLSGHDAGNAGG
ncbi:unnamed protein product, partial [Ectocarpus sp. 12 AP-2014]